MKLGRVLFILPLVLLVPVHAPAHDHNAEASAGGVYENGSDLFGAYFSHEWSAHAPDPLNPKKWRPFTLIAEGSFVADSDKSRTKVLGGVGFSPLAALGCELSLHALGGVYYNTDREERATSPFTGKLGVSIDLGITDNKGWRVQADWIFPPGKKSHLQVGIGLVWRKAALPNAPPLPTPHP